MLKALLRYMHPRGWEVNTMKIQELTTAVKLLAIHWSGVCQDIPSKVKDKLLPLAAPITKKVEEHYVGLSCFWRQHILNEE